MIFEWLGMSQEGKPCSEEKKPFLLVSAAIFVVSLVLLTFLFYRVTPESIHNDSFGQWVPLIAGSVIALVISSLARFAISRTKKSN